MGIPPNLALYLERNPDCRSKRGVKCRVCDFGSIKNWGLFRVVGKLTGYTSKGSDNFEHDDAASQMNYSGVEDDVFSAEAEHDGWQEGYDF
ncbi:hypothetical protein ACIUV2_25060 [Pseudomonas aeruginosa]|nr:hypothetical protein [Pseudomonas aeruginosa]